ISADKTRSKGRIQAQPKHTALFPYCLTALIQLLNLCSSPTWWLWRSGCTRSHSELGRETLQRQWYFVLRCGRVGRCQVCKAHKAKHLIKIHTKQFASASEAKKYRLNDKREWLGAARSA